MTPARLVQAPAVPTTEIIDLAFFTIGDNRAAGSPPDLLLTMEQMWRRRAEALAPGHFHAGRDGERPFPRLLHGAGRDPPGRV